MYLQRTTFHPKQTGLSTEESVKFYVNPFVEIENVTLSYSEEIREPAVQGLSMSISEGEFCAVVGPSGCGKSTLMKLVTGLLFPQTGEIRVNGGKVNSALKIAGMAFQNPVMLPWRKTLENLLLPLEIVSPHRERLRREKQTYVKQAQELLKTVGLEGCGDQYPWELSGGMQQRASLCRALIHEPKLLMLDEPFAALDSFTREELWCVMRDLWQKKGFTVILVTHDLPEAVFLADRIFVMSSRPGRILVERKVDLPRPRELDLCFTPEFTSIVHELRGHISEARA